MRIARRPALRCRAPGDGQLGELGSLDTRKRLIAKPAARRLGFKALIATKRRTWRDAAPRDATPADVLVQE